MNAQVDVNRGDAARTDRDQPRCRILSDEANARYRRDGFAVVKGFFDAEEIAPIRAGCGRTAHLSNVQTQVRDGAGRSYGVAIWTQIDDSLLGMLPCMERIVVAVESLLGRSCYHWHSKLLRKQPGDGEVGIHQDYATWYEDGCLFPHLLTCSIIIDASHRENGGVYFIPGSHRMARIHRVLLGDTIDQHGPDPAAVQAAVQRLGLVYPTLSAGDAVFFHCNTLHGSDPNTSDQARTVIHCSYNAVDNQPLSRPGQEHHRYRPMRRVADDFIVKRRYSAVLREASFHPAESEDDVGAGIFFRSCDRDVASPTR